MACPLCVAKAGAEGASWDYERGARGPDKWGELDNGFKACATGREQSPINLTDAVRARIPHFEIDWKPETYQIVNDGHTIQANVAADSRLTIGKESYTLKQFHFHTPSEHAFDGERLAMEAHFVHAQPSGHLAVVGVLMVAGKRRHAFSDIMAVAPKQKGEARLVHPLDAAELLPRLRSVYRYEGSLTTPPCDEVVDWNICEHTVEVAQADIDAFRAIFPMNARPLQPLNRRFVLQSFGGH